MDKADRAGLSVAIAGHVLLFGALSVGLANILPPKPVPPPAMEVEFVNAVSFEPAIAEPADEMPAAEAPVVSLVAEAISQPVPVPTPEAPVPELLPAPPPLPAPAVRPVLKPEPVRAKPVEKAAAKQKPKPESTLAKPVKQTASADPAVVKAAPAKVAKLTPPKIKEPAPVETRVAERPKRTAEPAKPRQLAAIPAKSTRIKPAPAKRERATAVASKPPTAPVKIASANRALAPLKSAPDARPATVRSPAAKVQPARGTRLGRDLLAGLSDAPEAKPATSAAPVMNPNAMAVIQAAIKRQVQPCADRQVNPGPGANRISVKLNLKLNKDGSLASAPQVVSTTGIDDENSRYEKRVADLAFAAFTGCAPLAGLPDELYRTPKGGWSNFNMNYRLPG